jgi:hypothetical protein
MPRHRLALLHARFLSLVPRIRLHGRVYFQHVRCPFTREDLIAEMVAVCWRWFLRLVQRRKDPTRFASALAGYAARAVNSGRRVVGMDRTKDVLSARARRRHGFTVGKLPDFGTLSTNPLEEALADNTQTPVPEQVSFRLDFPAWRLGYGRRDREMIDGMLLGERTLDLANRHGISPARVSQKRREFRRDWERFTADPAEREPGSGHA